jgi:hypothetical protein
VTTPRPCASPNSSLTTLISSLARLYLLNGIQTVTVIHSVYDPPLLPSPLPLLRDLPSDNTPPQACTDLEDAFGGLLREMNSWRFAPASRSALTLTLTDRNKVRLALQLNLLPWVHSPTQALPYPPSLPPPWNTSPLHRDRPIITYFFLFSSYTGVFFPAPTSSPSQPCRGSFPPSFAHSAWARHPRSQSELVSACRRRYDTCAQSHTC